MTDEDSGPDRDHYTKVADSAAARRLAAAFDAFMAGHRHAKERRYGNAAPHLSGGLRRANHPGPAHLPIGIYLASVVCYIGRWDDAAAVLTIVGVAAAFVAAVTGLADWTAAQGIGKRLGAVHGGFNVVATIVAVASFVVYYAAGVLILAAILQAVALVLTALAAHLGGHLVFVRRLGMTAAAVEE